MIFNYKTILFIYTKQKYMLQNQFPFQKTIQSSLSLSNQIDDNKNKRKSKIPISPYIKWTKQEDVLYVRFLKANVDRMKKIQFRKPYNKFKKMSQYVTSKDSFQCRSHHQKMMKKFGSIEGIIHSLSSTLQKLTQLDHINQKQKITSQVIDTFTKIVKSPSVNKNDNIFNSQIQIEKLHVQIKPQIHAYQKTKQPTLSPTNEDFLLLPQDRNSTKIKNFQKQLIMKSSLQIPRQFNNSIYHSFEGINFLTDSDRTRQNCFETYEMQRLQNINLKQFEQMSWNQNLMNQNALWWYWHNYYRHQQYLNWCLMNPGVKKQHYQRQVDDLKAVQNLQETTKKEQKLNP